ncbi:hypothetical protein KY329_05730 [Candidatus Woesearchaeota archaeon]|nr:hypothetical protein [Candidatus Woesearchaeota archaeon]
MKKVNNVKDIIPERMKKFPEYRLFLVWVREADAETPAALKKELKSDIRYYEKMLKEDGKNSRLGLKNHILRAQSKYIDFLKRAEKLFLKYL